MLFLFGIFVIEVFYLGTNTMLFQATQKVLRKISWRFVSLFVMCTVECFVFIKVSFTHSYCESIECRANRADEIYVFGVKLVSNRFALSFRT